MQLSSRILTALAVLILAVTVVAVRAGSPGTVEAATGTIDVVNVGTCYTTDSEVFGIGDCDDGDEGDYDVAGRDRLSPRSGSVYRDILPTTRRRRRTMLAVCSKNSNLIKISICRHWSRQAHAGFAGCWYRVPRRLYSSHQVIQSPNHRTCSTQWSTTNLLKIREGFPWDRYRPTLDLTWQLNGGMRLINSSMFSRELHDSGSNQVV